MMDGTQIRLAAMAVVLFAAPADAIIVRHDADPHVYEAAENEHPATFGLLRTRRGSWDCPATLISAQWAITAGHCASDPRIVEAMQGSGGYAVEIAGAANAIDRVETPPDGSDAALLHLSSPVANVTPIPLHRTPDERGQIVLMLGWGDTGDGVHGVIGLDGKFRAATNVVDQVEAGVISWTFSDPRERSSDVTTLEGISGPGDSGGPALIETGGVWRLAGISSGQDPMGHARGSYGVREYYVRVSALAPWIDQLTSGQDIPAP